MNKCVGTSDNEADPGEDTRKKSNREYLTMTLILIIPNFAFFIYGIVVLAGAAGILKIRIWRSN